MLSRSRYHLYLLALLLAAFLLRAWNLGGKSLWLDEAFAVWNADRTPTQIWHEVNDNHPPTYYLMLHYWQSVSRDATDYERLLTRVKPGCACPLSLPRCWVWP